MIADDFASIAAALTTRPAAPAADQLCVKPGPCPCDQPCRWALQALDDVRQFGWPGDNSANLQSKVSQPDAALNILCEQLATLTAPERETLDLAISATITMHTTGPDAELIGLCERLAELTAAERAILATQDTIEAEHRTEPELVALTHAMKEVFDRITALPDPVTLAGARAMAVAALADAPMDLDGSISVMENAEWLAFGALTFLAGQQGRPRAVGGL